MWTSNRSRKKNIWSKNSHPNCSLGAANTCLYVKSGWKVPLQPSEREFFDRSCEGFLCNLHAPLAGVCLCLSSHVFHTAFLWMGASHMFRGVMKWNFICIISWISRMLWCLDFNPWQVLEAPSLLYIPSGNRKPKHDVIDFKNNSFFQKFGALMLEPCT